MQEISEQETNELEGHGDHAVPDKGEDGADGEAVDVDLIGGHAGSEDGGFPVWRCRICGGLFVCLEGGQYAMRDGECRVRTYRRLFFVLFTTLWLCGQICKDTVCSPHGLRHGSESREFSNSALYCWRRSGFRGRSSRRGGILPDDSRVGSHQA